MAEHGYGQLGCSPRGTPERLCRIPLGEVRVFRHHCCPSLVEVCSQGLLTWSKPAEQGKTWEKVRETEAGIDRDQEIKMEIYRLRDKEKA